MSSINSSTYFSACSRARRVNLKSLKEQPRFSGGERSVSLELAIQAGFGAIDSIGVRRRVTFIGNHLRTVRCELLSKSGGVVALGMGKGVGEQAVASAVFEALEHLATDAEARSGDTVGTAWREVAKQPELFDDTVIAFAAARWPNEQTTCRVYQSLVSSGQLLYPAVLSLPDRVGDDVASRSPQDRFLARYSSNNGTAAGTDDAEAVVHSLGEVVERDALSRFLIETFLRVNPLPIRLLDLQRLPLESRALVASAEKELGAKVNIVMLANEFGVPVFLAVSERCKGMIRPRGSGASLDRAYALERAVLELVQFAHSHSVELESEDRSVVHSLAMVPKYQDCYRLDLGEMVSSGRFIRVVFDGSDWGRVSTCVTANLDELLGRLMQNERRVFGVQNRAVGGGWKCWHVLVPGLERFHPVAQGSLVVPGARGRAWLC